MLNVKRTPTVNLYQQVYEGQNGTRIYESGGRYYAVDGEISCDVEHAYNDLLDYSYFSHRNPDEVLRYVTRGDDRFPQ